MRKLIRRFRFDASSVVTCVGAESFARYLEVMEGRAYVPVIVDCDSREMPPPRSLEDLLPTGGGGGGGGGSGGLSQHSLHEKSVREPHSASLLGSSEADDGLPSDGGELSRADE